MAEREDRYLNDQNLGARYQQDQLAPSPPRHYSQDQLMNTMGSVTMTYAEYRRLRAVEAAAREVINVHDNWKLEPYTPCEDEIDALRIALRSGEREGNT